MATGTEYSLSTVKAVVLLDTSGNRIISKYYCSETAQEQFAFEKLLFEKTKRLPNAEIIMLDNQLVLYKSSLDVFIYVIAHSSNDNEIMTSAILNTFYDALCIMLSQIEKRSILENIDSVLLAIDETFDDGIVLEFDSTIINQRVSKRSDRDNIPLSEQTISQALRSAQEQLTRSLLK